MTISNGSPQWRKSSWSANTASCVEVARMLDGLRDSKHPSTMLAVDVRPLVKVVKNVEPSMSLRG